MELLLLIFTTIFGVVFKVITHRYVFLPLFIPMLLIWFLDYNYKINSNDFITFLVLVIWGVWWLIITLIIIKAMNIKRRTNTGLGDAQFSNRSLTSSKKLFLNKRPLIGKIKKKYLHGNLYHMQIIAPSRGGKGVGFVVPNLVCNPLSMIVLDPKNELYAKTHEMRLNMGHEIISLEPFGKSHSAIGFNPLKTIDPFNMDAIGDINNIIDHLFTDESDHWSESAKTILLGVVLFVCRNSIEEKNLTSVRKIIVKKGEIISALLNDAKDDEFGSLQKVSDLLNGTNPKELDSILSTARRATKFLDDPYIASFLSSKTSIDFKEFKYSLKTCYINIPPEKMLNAREVLRLIIGDSLKSCLTDLGNEKVVPVVFLLDEVSQLGKMLQIENALGIAAGYEVYLWLIFQDLGQLKKNYNMGTVTANTNKLYLGFNDLDSADYVSKMLGNHTISVESTSFNKDHNTLSTSLKETALFKVDELLKMTDQVIFLRHGFDPALVTKIKYFEDKFISPLVRDHK